MRHVISQPEEELYHLLASLQRKEFLYEQPAFPEIEYSFKHALTQEVAYSTVLTSVAKPYMSARRRRSRRCIATIDDHYSELAHHYSRSGNTPKAVEYLHLAGQQAAQRSANTEAISHLTMALGVTPDPARNSGRARQEFALHLALGPPLIATKGTDAPEVEHAYTRARELCLQSGRDATTLSESCRGCGVLYCTRRDHLSRELAEQCLEPGPAAPRPSPLHGGPVVLGDDLTIGSENSPRARAHSEQCIALYDSPAPLPRSWLIDQGRLAYLLRPVTCGCLAIPTKHSRGATRR